jgi:hypothetical protein
MQVTFAGRFIRLVAYLGTANLLALLAPSALATVIFDNRYVVDLNRGATGVATGDIVHVEAFYEPTLGVLHYRDDDNIAYAFTADAAGLAITVNGQVWRTTAGLTVDTQFVRGEVNDDGVPIGVDRVVVQFIAETRPQFLTGYVPTTLSTPWSADVTRNLSDNEFLFFLPTFVARPGIDPSQAYLPPRLYSESDFASLLMELPSDAVGAAFANTATGERFFNFGGAALGDPSAVPEPTSLWLFAIAGLLLVFAGSKTAVQRFLKIFERSKRARA